MTEQEAIRILDINKIISFRCTGFVEAAECAISVLEKQIPKKPNYNKIWFAGIFSDYSETEYRCPECDCGLRKSDEYKDNYCPNCGQAIDWSDEE